MNDGNHTKWLISRAHAVNFVWNWCNDAQKHAIWHNQKWPSGFDLNKLSSGCGQELGLIAKQSKLSMKNSLTPEGSAKGAASGIGAKKLMVGFHSKPWVLGFRMAASSTAGVS